MRIKPYPFCQDKVDDPTLMIIGSGRSGNTLLRRMLMASGQVVIPPESYVLRSVCRRYSLWRFLPWQQISTLVIKHFSSHPEFHSWDIDEKTALQQALILPKKQRSLRNIFKCLYTHYADHHKIPYQIWGDKTPLNSFGLSYIFKAFPDAHYIHIIRDPRAVALSYRKAAMSNNSIAEDTIDKAAERWKNSIKSIEDFKASHPEVKVFDIRYEDLLAAPEDSLKALSSFLGLTYFRKMIDHESAPASLGDVERYAHHENVQKPIDISRIEAWKDEIGDDDRKTFEALCADYAKLYGYI